MPNDEKQQEPDSLQADGSAKLVAVTEMRRVWSGLLVEQTIGLRDDINVQTERLLIALYEAGASRAAALLEKYAPRHHGMSHARKCPACGGWWPRHAETCEIAEVISPNVKVSYHADNSGGAHGKDTNDK